MHVTFIANPQKKHIKFGRRGRDHNSIKKRHAMTRIPSIVTIRIQVRPTEDATSATT